MRSKGCATACLLHHMKDWRSNHYFGHLLSDWLRIFGKPHQTIIVHCWKYQEMFFHIFIHTTSQMTLAHLNKSIATIHPPKIYSLQSISKLTQKCKCYSARPNDTHSKGSNCFSHAKSFMLLKSKENLSESSLLQVCSVETRLFNYILVET